MTWTVSRAAVVRAAPFAVFMVMLAIRGALPTDGSWGVDPRWIYLVTVAVVGAMLAWWWPDYGELAPATRAGAAQAAQAVVVGWVVFALWIHLDAPWMQLGRPSAAFLPLDPQGRWLWPLILGRWVGASLLVPVMEELFWRSFIMRWIEDPHFTAVPPQAVGIRAVVLSTFVFMLAHTLWLAAVLAGLAYAGLYRRTGKLWVAVLAHAVTNATLGVWVVMTGRWEFW